MLNCCHANKTPPIHRFLIQNNKLVQCSEKATLLQNKLEQHLHHRTSSH